MFLTFAWRYFKAKKSTNAINIIAWVSVLAMVIGAASLVLVLSVFNGFEDLVRSLYSSFYTDLKITPAKGKILRLSRQQLLQLGATPGVAQYSLIVEDQALLQNGEIHSPIVYLKGVDSNYVNVAGVSRRIVKGKFALGTADQPAAVLGAGIENALDIESDRSILPLSVYLFKKGNAVFADSEKSFIGANPMSSISTATMAAAGTFVIQADFDNKYVITNIDFMKRMLGLGPDEYSSVEIALKDAELPGPVQQLLRNQLGTDFLIQTRYEENRGLYGVMRTERWVIYAVLTLILIVAAFNMVGALTMLVLEKQKDIQVLKALGADNPYIQKIFLAEGVLLAVLGAGTGILLALLICWLQVKFKLVPLSGDSFLIDYYPVKLVGGDFVLVFVTVLAVALLASWFPARKAALQPIELKS